MIHLLVSICYELMTEIHRLSSSLCYSKIGFVKVFSGIVWSCWYILLINITINMLIIIYLFKLWSKLVMVYFHIVWCSMILCGDEWCLSVNVDADASQQANTNADADADQHVQLDVDVDDAPHILYPSIAAPHITFHVCWCMRTLQLTTSHTAPTPTSC